MADFMMVAPKFVTPGVMGLPLSPFSFSKRGI